MPITCHSVEEAEDLASDPLPACLLMVHDARRGRQNNQAKLTRGQQAPDPVLDVVVADVIARRDNAAFVQAAVQLNDDLARAVVIHVLELANVPVLLQVARMSRCSERGCRSRTIRGYTPSYLKQCCSLSHLHQLKKLDDHLGGWANEDLPTRLRTRDCVSPLTAVVNLCKSMLLSVHARSTSSLSRDRCDDYTLCHQLG